MTSALARVLLLVLAVTCARSSIAQSIVTYEGTGEVTTASTSFGLLPFAVKQGDELRFRAQILRTARIVAPSDLGGAYDGTAYYGGAVRDLEVWINGSPVTLGPTSDETLRNIFTVRNDVVLAAGFGSVDEFQFIWRHRPSPDVEVEFVAGLLADHQHAPMDWLTSSDIPLQFDFGAANGGGMNFRVSRFRTTNGFQVADYDEIAVRPTSFRPLLGAAPVFSALPVLSSAETWLAAATTAQVPGAAAADGSRVAAAIWFNGPLDESTFQLTDQGLQGATRISIRCGAAGSAGPVVWTSTEIERSTGAETLLRGRDLLANTASAACPVVIRNIAALKAAAEDRLLYLEVERAGPTLRGQFWPNGLSLHRGGWYVSHAGTSDQQVVGSQSRAPLWVRAPVIVMFSDTAQNSGVMHYEIPQRHRFGSATLHCAPAGVDGARVAALPAERGVLSNADLTALAASSTCDVSLTTTAALLEALLRGQLYAVLEPNRPEGLVLRGQFRAP